MTNLTGQAQPWQGETLLGFFVCLKIETEVALMVDWSLAGAAVLLGVGVVIGIGATLGAFVFFKVFR